MCERMKIAKLLWSNNISAEYSHQDNPKFKRQLEEVLERGIAFTVVVAEEELARGCVKVKDMRARDEVELPFDQVVPFLLSRGCRSVAVGDQSFMKKIKGNLAATAASSATAMATSTESS